jgi:hypothetical protein
MKFEQRYQTNNARLEMAVGQLGAQIQQSFAEAMQN